MKCIIGALNCKLTFKSFPISLCQYDRMADERSNLASGYFMRRDSIPVFMPEMPVGRIQFK